jgi:hypothetical protein
MAIVNEQRRGASGAKVNFEDALVSGDIPFSGKEQDIPVLWTEWI